KDSGFYANKINTGKLIIDGLIYNSHSMHNLSFTGNNIPFNDIMETVLFMKKYNNNNKVFLENFYDFKGLADLDILWNNDGIFGEAKGTDLYAKAHLFNIPLRIPNADFYFNGRDIKSTEEGFIGKEKTIHSFEVTGIGTPELTVNGNLRGVLTAAFAKEYIPDTSILGKTKLKVKYLIKNKKIDVFYEINVPKGSDIFYQNAYLSLREFDRILKVHTTKENDLLFINKYEYLLKDKEHRQIIHGDGLLKKQNGHYKLNKISWQTNGYAPATVTGSFGQYVNGGKFIGALTYDFEANKLNGNFTLEDSSYKDFDLDKAHIEADDNQIIISANGSYDDEDLNCYITADNNFANNKIKIHSFNIFLNKYTIHRGEYKVKHRKINLNEHIKNLDLTIDNFKIQVNKIVKDRIIVKNIIFIGKLQNNIFDFKTENIEFAHGILTAIGHYDIQNHAGEANINANNIDSDTIADMIFNLPNQVKGIAQGTIHIITKKRFNDIKAHTEFTIKDGYLPQLGSTEFLIKHSKRNKKPIKIRIKDFVSFDMAKQKALCSNIKGSFDIDNYNMENIELAVQHAQLSFYLEGDYNMKSQTADIKLYGNYNTKLINNVKILFVPLSWIIKLVFKPEQTIQKYRNKLNKIPNISSDSKEHNYFRVKMQGKINDKKDLKLELKRIL
ncbi:hypothetical protein II906_03280, partial [bacterium]|nr:hypothetical protein [bacterium]